MILVDTSVWVDHLRRPSRALQARLEGGEVLTHPFVVGELACGGLRHRARVLGLLTALPRAVAAEHEEVLRLIANRRLYGRGLGWVDAHVLASTLLTNCRLWTLDKPLRRIASELRVGADDD